MTQQFKFSTEYHCPIGELETVAPGLRRITANNPGPLTFRGTGTYVVGEKQVALIDPGPADPAHIDAIMSELGDETISHILVTHTHRDHSAGTALLQARCGAPSYSLGNHTALQRPSPLPQELDAAGDTDFTPDVVLTDGQTLSGATWSLQCIHTPGHASNHAAFAQSEHRRLFVGDLVMGWSTPVLLPPDGHLKDYLRSLKKLLSRDDATYWPTHGGPIEDTQALLDYLIDHRMQRIESVFTAIQQGKTQLSDIVDEAYPELGTNLKPAAMRSTLASVIYLVEEKRLRADLSQGLSITCSIA